MTRWRQSNSVHYTRTPRCTSAPWWGVPFKDSYPPFIADHPKNWPSLDPYGKFHEYGIAKKNHVWNSDIGAWVPEKAGDSLSATDCSLLTGC
jgi:hypothetical protein